MLKGWNLNRFGRPRGGRSALDVSRESRTITTWLTIGLLAIVAGMTALVPNPAESQETVSQPRTQKLDAILAGALNANTRLSQQAGQGGDSGYRIVEIGRDIPALPSRVITDAQGRAFVDALIKTNGFLDGIEDQGVAIQSVVGDIAAARVPVDSLGALVSLPNVEFIQKARSYKPLNDISIPATGASAVHDTGVDGSGVIVGIIDTGVDYTHPDFRNPDDGTTRIKFICDQTDPAQPGDNTCPGTPDPDNPAVPGTLWTEDQINAALLGGGGVRQTDTNGHGTHVLGSAAGGDSVYRGVAPGADLIVVKTDFMDNNIMSALDFIDQKAEVLGMPYVVNMSLGSQLGPHDGTDLLSKAINSMVGPGMPGKAIVVAAGNDGGRNVHASADLSDGSEPIVVSVAPVLFEAIDIWYDGGESFSVGINDPSGAQVPLETANGLLAPGESSPFDDKPDDDDIPFHCDEQSNTCFRIDHSLPLAANGDIEILVMFLSLGLTCDPGIGPTCGPIGPMGTGTWTLNLTGNVVSNGILDAWCGFFCEFGEPHGDDVMTISEPGVAQNAITAGAFTTRVCWDTQNSPPPECYPSPSPALDELAGFSSRGPTRSGLLKPDIAAPGQGVVSTRSSDSSFAAVCGGPPGATTSGGGHVLCQGTSMATAHVTGAVALMLSVDPTLDAAQIKARLQESATRDEFTESPVATPNNAWGWGKLNVAAAIGADLSISKEADVEPAIAGENLTYIITVTNKSPDAAAENVVITDTLPAGLSFVQEGSDGVFDEQTNTWRVDVGTLSVEDGPRAFTLVVAVDPSVAHNATIANQASVASATPDPNLDNNSAPLNTTVVREADLQLTKEANLATVAAGGQLTYTLTVTNNGPSDAAGVMVTDTPPEGVIYDAGWSSPECAPGQVVEGIIDCDIGALGAGDDFELTIVVSVPIEFAGASLNNHVMVSSNTDDPDESNNSDSLHTAVIEVADLVIEKSDNYDPVVPEDTTLASGSRYVGSS